MKDKELSIELENWIKIYQNHPQKYSKTYTGQIIRKFVQISDNWQNAPRGNPRKGGLIRKAQKLQEISET